MKEIKQLENYYKNNEIDLDAIIDDFSTYITTIINNGTDNRISFEDKEEIFSDTFFILWKNWKRININISLNSYLVGITKNLIKEKYRKRKIDFDMANYDDIDITNNIDLYNNERETLYDLENKIKNLNDKDKEIIKLFYYSSKSVKDIAKILNMSEFNVKTKLHRIRKKIKQEFKNGGAL